MEKSSIYGLTWTKLTEWLEAHGQKKFRATQVWDWLYRKRVKTFEEMSNVPKETIELFNSEFCDEHFRRTSGTRIDRRHNEIFI